MKMRFGRFFGLALAALIALVGPSVTRAQIQVDSTNPSTAPQGSINLNVTINGNGFKKGAVAKWFVTGTTNPGGVTVNSTAFVSSAQLTANITISSSANISGYDVEVTAAGRTGKGTDLFAVTQSGTKVDNIPVTTTLNQTGSVTPDPGTNYRVQSDDNGSYFNGVGNVSSTVALSDSSDWILDTRGSTTRTVLVDLRSPIPNSGAQAPFAWQDVPVRIIAQCHLALAGSFPAMALNQTLSCPLFVRFTYAGTDYRLAMSSGPTLGQGDFAETNNAQVTCNAISGESCVGWTVVPVTQAGGAVENVARLQRFGNGGKLTDLGDFYVTFNFTVTNP